MSQYRTHIKPGILLPTFLKNCGIIVFLFIIGFFFIQQHQAEAAFSAITARGQNVEAASDTSLTVSPTANLTIGKLVIVSAVTDNAQTTDGTSTLHTITDTTGANTWTKVLEETETDGAANDGSTTSLWYTIVSNTIATTDSITLTLGSARTAKTIGVVEATFDYGTNTIAYSAVAATHSTTGSNTSISQVRSAMTNREYLFYGLHGAEGNDNSKTAIANYAERYDIRSGSTASTAVQHHIATRILTGTGDTFTTSAVTYTSAIQSLVGFYETAAPFVISGTCKQYDKTTNCTNGLTVKFAKNGVLQAQTAVTAGGAYSITGGTASTDDNIHIFLDNVDDNQEAVVVSYYDGTGAMVNANLIAETLVIGTDDNVINGYGELDDYDYSASGDEDIFFDVDGSGVLDTDATSQSTQDRLYIYKNFQTNAPVITVNLEVPTDGSLNTESNTAPMTIAGSFTVAGTWTANTNTTTFTSTSGGRTISSASTFYDVIFNGSGGNWAVSGTMTVTQDILMTAGTLSGTGSVTVNGGDVTGTGTIAMTGGTFLVDTAGSFGSATGWSFSNLTFGNGSGSTTTTATGAGTITVTGNLLIASAQTLDLNTNDKPFDITGNVTINNGTPGVLQASNTALFAVGGTWLTSGTFTHNNGTVTFDATAQRTITSAASSFFNVTLDGVGGLWAPGSATTVTIAGDLTVTNGTINNTGGTGNIIVNGNVQCGVTCGTITITSAFTQSVGASAKNFGTNVAVATNWSFGALTFTATGGTAITTSSTGTGTITATTITISANTVLNAGNRTFIITNTGTPFTVTGTFTAQTSTIRFTGNGATTITRTTYYNLESTPAGSVTHTLAGGGALQINGNLVIGTGSNASILNASTNDPIIDINGNFTVNASGTFTASDAQNLTIGGNWTNSGTFTHNNRTVIFDTTGTSTIAGTTTFYNFTSTTAGKTIRFTNSQTFTVANVLTLTGSTGNNIIITNTSSTTQWLITLSGTASVSFVTVSNSGCSGGNNITTTSSTDAGNNGVCWILPAAGITVSGTIYSDEGTTAITGGRTIRVVNEADTVYSGASDGSGVFSISSISAPAGSALTIYIENATENGVVFTRSNNADITGLNIYQNRIILRSDDASPLTIDDTWQFDGGDDGDGDIGLVSDAGSNGETTISDGWKVIVWTGDTFNPVSNITTSVSTDGTDAVIDGDFEIQSGATMTMAGNNLSIGGDFSNAGTMTYSATQTTTFTATATGFTIADNTSNFHNLTFNGASGGWSFTSAVILGGDLVVTAGTLSGTQDLTVNGADATGNGTINLSGGTFAIDGTGTLGGSTAWTFNNLTFGDGSGATTTTASSSQKNVSGNLTVAANQTLNLNTNDPIVDINGNLTINADGILQASGSSAFTIGGNMSVPENAILVANGGTITLDATDTDNTFEGYYPCDHLHNITFNGSGAVWTKVGEEAMCINGALVVTAGTFVTDSSIYLNTGTAPSGAGVITSSAAITTGGVGLANTGNWTFGELHFGDGGSGTITNTNAGSLTATTIVLETGYTLNAGAKTYIITGSGTPFTRVGTFTADTSTFRYTSTSATTITSTTYYNLETKPAGTVTYTLAGGTLTVNNNFDIGNGTNTNTINWDTNDAAITVKGNFTLNNNTAWTKSGTATLTLSPSGTKTWTDSNGTAVDIGTVSISGGTSTPRINIGTGTVSATTVTLAASHELNANGSNNLIITGSGNAFVITGTFTPGTGEVNFSSSSATNIDDATYYRLYLGGSTTFTLNSGTFNFSEFVMQSGVTMTVNATTNDPTINMNGDFNIGNLNTFIASNSSLLNISGSYQAGGGSTFTHSNGTVAFTTSSTISIAAYSATGNTFYNFTSTVAGKTIRFQTSQTFNFAGTLTLTGADGNPINVTSTSGSGLWSAFFTNAQTSATITYVNLSWSGCAASTQTVTFNATSTDGGNNTATCWIFPAVGITISGTIYSDEGTTAITSGPTIRIKVNGAGSYTTTANGSGVYSISTITVSAGQVITIYIDDATPNAVAYTRAINNATNITGLNLFQNRVIIRTDDAGLFTNANANQWDASNDSDGDIGIASDGTNVVLSDGWKLLVWDDATYVPGGTITTSPSNDGTDSNVDGDIFMKDGGLISMETNALSVGGDFQYTGGFEFDSGQTTTFTATATGHSIECAGDFHNITFNGSGGGWAWVGSGWPIIYGDLTMTAGTLTGEKFLANGNVTGNGVITMSGQTTEFMETKNVGGNSDWSFSNVQMGNGSTRTTTFTGSGSFTVTGTLTISATHTLDAGSKTIILSGSSTPFVKTGTFTRNASTVRYTGTSATNVTSATYWNLELQPASGSPTYTAGAADLAADNNFTLGDGSNAVTLNLNTNDPAFYVLGNFTLNNNTTYTPSVAGDKLYLFPSGTKTITDNNGTKQNLGEVEISNGTSTPRINLGSNIKIKELSIASSHTLGLGSFTLELTGYDSAPLVSSGTVVPGTGTVLYSANYSTTIANVAYNNLTLQPSANTITFTLATGAFVVDGNLLLGNGTNTASVINLSTNDPTLDVNGNLTINANTTLTASDAQDMTVAGSWSNAGTFTHNSRTVTFDGGSPGQTIVTGGTGQPFHNLTINGAGAWSASTNAILVSNDLVVNTGTLQGNQNVTVNGGDVSGSGYVNMSGGTFTIDAAGNLGGSSNAWTFSSLSLTGASTTTTATSSGGITVTGVLTIGANHVLNAGSKTWTLSGTGTPFVTTGTFTASTSTFAYTGNGATNVTSNTYNNLSIIPAGAVTHTPSSGTLTVNGDLVIGNSSNNVTVNWDTNDPTTSLKGNITLNSPSTWTKSATATLTVSPTGTKVLTDNNSTKQDLGIVSIISGTSTPRINLGGSITATTLAIAASHTLDINGTNTITLTGNGASVLANSGTFTISTGSTIDFTSANTTGTTIPTLAYHNLTLNKASNTFTNASGALNIGGNLNLTAGTYELNTNDPTVLVTGNVTIGGTLSASNTNPLTVRGNFVNNGTFTHNNGSVVLNPTADNTFINGSSETTFYDLSATNISNKTLQFKASATTTIAHNLSLSGVSGGALTVRSDSSSTQWDLSLAGTPAIDYVIFQDTGCFEGTTSVNVTENVFDGGNNGLCLRIIKRGGSSVSAPADSGSSGGGSGETGGDGDGGSGGSDGDSGGGEGQGGGGQGGGGGGGSP